MNNTSAVLVIIHALWPGPATPTVTGAVTVRLPLVSFVNEAAGSPLLM